MVVLTYLSPSNSISSYSVPFCPPSSYSSSPSYAYANMFGVHHLHAYPTTTKSGWPRGDSNMICSESLVVETVLPGVW